MSTLCALFLAFIYEPLGRSSKIVLVYVECFATLVDSKVITKAVVKLFYQIRIVLILRYLVISAACHVEFEQHIFNYFEDILTFLLAFLLFFLFDELFLLLFILLCLFSGSRWMSR
jgi:hypothetical protein